MRVKSIDTLKAVAMVAIISNHCGTFKYINWLANVIADQGDRFSGVYFFIAAGYLFKKSVEKKGDIKIVYAHYAKRILVLFGFWSLVHLFYPNQALLAHYGLFNSTGYLLSISQKIQWILDNPLIFLLEGTDYPFWFLVSLLMSVTLLYLMVSLQKERWLLPVGIFLYIFGLLGGAYSPLPIGFNYPINTHYGPIISTLCIVIGWYLARTDYQPSLRTSVLMITGGYISMLLECFLLYKFYHVNPLDNEYLIGTIFYGAGFMFLALAKPDLGGNTPLPLWGSMMLGIFVIHTMVIPPVMTITRHLVPFAVLRDIITPPIVFLVSLIIVTIIARYKTFRPLVM